MIRLLRAFALLRWRLFINMLRGRKRDSFEQVSRVSRLFVAATTAVTIIPGSLVLAFLAFIGARGLAQGNPKAAPVLVGARAVLAGVTILVAVGPLLRFGAAPVSSTRLALLPIPRGLLHALELFAELTDPLVLAVVPGLIAMSLGFFAGGDAAAGLFAAALGAATLALLAALGSTASLLTALVFRNRRVGEFVTVAALFLLSAAALLTTPLFRNDSSTTREALRMFDGRGSVWIESLPWSLYANAIDGPKTAPALFLVLFALALLLVSRWSFDRLLDAPPERRSRSARGATPRRILGLSSAASAVAWTTFRLAARSVRGRVIMWTAPVPVLMLAIVWKRTLIGSGWSGLLGIIVFGVGSALTLFSLQTLVANQFAVDRAGLTLVFLSPASARDIVVGKAVGGGLAFAAPMAIALTIALILHPHGSGLLWAATLVMTLSAYLAQAPIAALVSAAFPAPCDLMKLRAGNTHPLAGVLGMVASVAASGAATLVFALAYAWSGSGLVVFAASLLVLAAAVGVAAALLPVAARTLDLRRENLAMIAQGR